MNVSIRHTPSGETVGDTFHESTRAAQEIIVVVRGQQLLEQIDRYPALVLEIPVFGVVLGGFAVANVETDIVVPGGDFFEVFLENMFLAIARAEEKPHLALLSAFH